jgi:fibronectin-binding autotransporter adhesin
MNFFPSKTPHAGVVATSLLTLINLSTARADEQSEPVGFHQTGGTILVIDDTRILTVNSSFESGVHVSSAQPGAANVTIGNGVKLTGAPFSNYAALSIGSGAGQEGVLNLSAGGSIEFDLSAVNSGIKDLFVATGGGKGTLNMTGGSILNAPGAKNYTRIWVGNEAGSEGVFNQSGGTVHNGFGSFYIGVNGGGGTYNISGDAVLTTGGGRLGIGHGVGSEGLLTVKDNAVVNYVFQDAAFSLGWSGGNGRIEQSDNSTVNILIGGYASIGQNTGSRGTYELNGGTLNFSAFGGGAAKSIVFGDAVGSVGEFIQKAGVSTWGDSEIQLGKSGDGEFTVEGGTATLQKGIKLAVNAGSTGTLNLSGGTLEVGGTNGISQGAGTAEFNWTGGTLKVVRAHLTSALDLNVIKSAATGAARATLETNEFNATLSGKITGDGVLLKTGAGVLTLTGDNLLTRGDQMTSSNKAEFYVVGGTVAQTAGTSVIDYVGVGSGAGANGTYTMSGGSLTTRQGFQVGDWDGIGQLNQTGGAITSIGSTNIGNQGGTGEFNLSGGTFTQTGGFASIGRSDRDVTSAGTLNLSGTGVFVVSSNGDLIIGDRDGNKAQGSGVLNQSGGTIRVHEGGQFWIGGYGDGTYNFTGGVIEVGGSGFNGRYGDRTAAGLSVFNFGGGTIKVVGSDLASNAAMRLASNTLSTLDTNGHNATFTSGISGAGGLVKTGQGNATLAGANSFAGLLVQQGSVTNGNGTTSVSVLAVGADGASGGNYTLSGGTLNVGVDDVAHGELTIGGGAGGSGSMVISGGVLNVGKENNFGRFFVGAYDGTGVMTHTGGTLNASGPFHLGNRGGHGTYNLSGGLLNVGQYPASGDSNSLTLGRSVSGGQTNVSQGYLNISGTARLVVNTNTPLLIGGDANSVAALSEGYVTQSGGTVSVSSWIDVGSKGRGEYHLNGGTLEISGANAIRSTSGDYVFNLGGGTLKAMNAALTTTVKAHAVADTTSTINTNGVSVTFNQGLSGTGGLHKTGAGDLVIAGVSDYAGELAVKAGALIVNGSFASARVVAESGSVVSGHGEVGSLSLLAGSTLNFGNDTGLLAVTGDLRLASNSMLSLTFTNGSELSALTIGGTLYAGGTLRLDFGNASQFDYETSFSVFEAGAIVGSFGTVILPNLSAGYAWDTRALNTTGVLAVSAVAVPEPSTWAALLGAGALAFAWWRRRAVHPRSA